MKQKWQVWIKFKRHMPKLDVFLWLTVKSFGEKKFLKAMFFHFVLWTEVCGKMWENGVVNRMYIFFAENPGVF